MCKRVAAISLEYHQKPNVCENTIIYSYVPAMHAADLHGSPLTILFQEHPFKMDLAEKYWLDDGFQVNCVVMQRFELTRSSSTSYTPTRIIFDGETMLSMSLIDTIWKKSILSYTNMCMVPIWLPNLYNMQIRVPKIQRTGIWQSCIKVGSSMWFLSLVLHRISWVNKWTAL